MTALILSTVALLLSAAALVLAVLVARQSGAVATTLARHRHGHTLRDGAADPGAARSRAARERPQVPAYGPPTTDLTAITPDAAQAAVEADTAEQPRLPHPGQIGRTR